MLRVTAICIVICALSEPLLAQGYVDPGAGAMIWQVVAASCVGAIFLFRKFVLRWFKRKR